MPSQRLRWTLFSSFQVTLAALSHLLNQTSQTQLRHSSLLLLMGFCQGPGGKSLGGDVILTALACPFLALSPYFSSEVSVCPMGALAWVSPVRQSVARECKLPWLLSLTVLLWVTFFPFHTFPLFLNYCNLREVQAAKIQNRNNFFLWQLHSSCKQLTNFWNITVPVKEIQFVFQNKTRYNFILK